MDKKTSYFQLASQEEREKKIDELKVLEQELGSLKKNAVCIFQIREQGSRN